RIGISQRIECGQAGGALDGEQAALRQREKLFNDLTESLPRLRFGYAFIDEAEIAGGFPRDALAEQQQFLCANRSEITDKPPNPAGGWEPADLYFRKADLNVVGRDAQVRCQHQLGASAEYVSAQHGDGDCIHSLHAIEEELFELDFPPASDFILRKLLEIGTDGKCALSGLENYHTDG